jgi:hypothetical protein
MTSRLALALNSAAKVRPACASSFSLSCSSSVNNASITPEIVPS